MDTQIFYASIVPQIIKYDEDKNHDTSEFRI